MSSRLASSRLKPVPLTARVASVRPVTRSVTGCIPTRSVGNDRTETATATATATASRASSLPQVGCLVSKTTSAQTGLFPAKAGPTKKHRVEPARPVTRSVRGCIPTQSVGTIKIKGFPAKAGPTKRKRVFDLQAHNGQTTPIATLVQAERRSRGVGRAAWMPREPPPAMDGGWRRVHGAGPE
jgi:hypothetical protein